MKSGIIQIHSSFCNILCFCENPSGIRNPEPGTRNQEPGIRNLEPGILPTTTSGQSKKILCLPLKRALPVTNMKSKEANRRLSELIEKAKEGMTPEAIADELLEIRDMAKIEADPAVIKILRLTAEYIGENEHFDLGYVEEEEIGEMSDLEYLLELVLHSDREANREEIRAIRDRLNEELYG